MFRLSHLGWLLLLAAGAALLLAPAAAARYIRPDIEKVPAHRLIDHLSEEIKEYRKVIETAWAKEKEMKSAPLGWHSVTAEASKYLIPYLDKEKDKEEIATLEERGKKLRMLPRPITPIVIPLEANLRVQD